MHATWPSHRETEEWGDTIPRGGIVERCDERGQGIKWPCADDACRSLRPDPWEGRDGRQRRAVHVERVLDRGEGPLSEAHDTHVDETVHPGPVRQPDQDRISADLSAVRHVAVLQLQEHVSENGPLGHDATEHLVVDRRAHRLLEPTELAVQPGRLELAPNRPHLPDVDPTDP